MYTPAYDAEAKRSAWLWRLVRHTVTHNHEREDFNVLLAALWTEFAALAQNPTAVLAPIGSPFALDEEPLQPVIMAA